MSVNKTLLADGNFTKKMADFYLSSAHPTVAQTGEKFGVPYHTASAAIKQHVPPEEFSARAAANKSRAKMGPSNPMYGVRTGGVIRRAKYLAQFDHAAGKYVGVHRRVFMESVGLSQWPEGWEVHHINDDPTDNRPDNLAIVTKRGHQLLHSQKLSGLLKWEREQFGTSLLQKITAILRQE
jgi:hypothetical protein